LVISTTKGFVECVRVSRKLLPTLFLVLILSYHTRHHEVSV
jgi:hypothetical protein